MIIIEKNQSPKKGPKNTNDKLMAFIAFPLLAVPTIEMQIAMVAVLTAVTVVMCIATLMFLFAMRKNNEEEEIEEVEEEAEETEEDEPDEPEEEEESDEDDEESAPEEVEEEPNVEEESQEEEIEETAEEEITEEETPYEEEAAVADEEENYEEETPEEETLEEENLEETAEEAYEETPEEEEVVEEENIDDVAEEKVKEEEVPEETTEEESLDDISEGETYEEETEEEETTEEESLDDADEESFDETPDEENVEEESLDETPEEEVKEDDDSDKDGGFGFALPLGWRRGVNKKEIADYLEEEFDSKVKTNRRQNFTKTGLPLADTHYVINNGKKECFAYVYEKEDSKFLIVKATDEIVEKYSKSTIHCTPSNFPKASEQWYKLTVDDDDEKGTENMYDMLADVVSARYERYSEDGAKAESVSLEDTNKAGSESVSEDTSVNTPSEENAAANRNIDMTEVLSEVAISDVSDEVGELSKSDNSDVSPKSITVEAGEDGGMFESAESNGEEGEN